MAISTALVSSALFICFNLLFFSLVSSTSVPCPPPAHPKKTPPPKPAACPPPPKPAACPPPPAKSKTPPPAKPAASCPKDALKLGVCANVLNGLINVVIGGTPSKTSCCSLLNGLADLDAAVCLCTALKANVLGINLNVPVSLSLLLNYCGKNVPSGYQCQ